VLLGHPRHPDGLLVAGRHRASRGTGESAARVVSRAAPSGEFPVDVSSFVTERSTFARHAKLFDADQMPSLG